jgi:hypothetical protein
MWSVAACASVTQTPSVEPIKPGDKIGDFLITTGDEADAANSHDLNCSQQGEGETYLCDSIVGTNLNVSNGIYDDQYSGKLDELWSNHTYAMTIDGRPVNLQAFGSLDYKHPTVGMMRFWNVVIVAEKPGEITVHSTGVAGDDPFDDTTTYVFIAP